MRKIALAIATVTTLAMQSAAPANAYSLLPMMLGHMLPQLMRPMMRPMMRPPIQNHGTLTCKMCPDTSGGLQGQDCIGWARNLHMQAVMVNNCGVRGVVPSQLTVLPRYRMRQVQIMRAAAPEQVQVQAPELPPVPRSGMSLLSSIYK